MPVCKLGYEARCPKMGKEIKYSNLVSLSASTKIIPFSFSLFSSSRSKLKDHGHETFL